MAKVKWYVDSRERGEERRGADKCRGGCGVNPEANCKELAQGQKTDGWGREGLLDTRILNESLVPFFLAFVSPEVFRAKELLFR